MAEDIKCPICGSDTVIKTAKKGLKAGQRFHVCLNYPDCKGKVPIGKQADGGELFEGQEIKTTNKRNKYIGVLLGVAAIIIVVISILFSGVLSNSETGAQSEQQVVQMTYDYLATKANKPPLRTELSWGTAGLQTPAVLASGWKSDFQLAILSISDLDGDEVGELVHMQFWLGSSSGWTGALKKIAKYQGNGLWFVSINDWEWQVNERTGEVLARNEETADLFVELSHRMYSTLTPLCYEEYFQHFCYSISYPAGWTVTEMGNEGRLAITCPEPQVDIGINEPFKLQPGQTLGESASGYVAFLTALYEDFQLLSLVNLENGDYQMDYEWIVGGTDIHSRTYLMLDNGWLYVITCSAPKSVYDTYLKEFDYSYNSYTHKGSS